MNTLHKKSSSTAYGRKGKKIWTEPKNAAYSINVILLISFKNEFVSKIVSGFVLLKPEILNILTTLVVSSVLINKGVKHD